VSAIAWIGSAIVTIGTQMMIISAAPLIHTTAVHQHKFA
jgi:hypothetical protein